MQMRKAIYEKALELFIQRGYDNTPLSHLAKVLGLSKAGLYHYFDSKEQLLFQIHHYQLEKDILPLIEEAKRISDPEKRLTYFLRAYSRNFATNKSAQVLVREIRRLDAGHYKTIARVWKKVLDLVRGTLAEMEMSGKSKKMNRTFEAFALIGMCAWSSYWFDDSRADSADELSNTYAEIFLRGILKPIR
jgi:AcrR family transcriptional regulator